MSLCPWYSNVALSLIFQMSLCPWFSKCHCPWYSNVALSLIFQMSLYPWFSNVIVSKQSLLWPFPRYEVMVQVPGGRPSFWYHATRWRYRPTYCIMHCKDDQCRAPWRHWPNCAGDRPTFGITPYRDVTDRIVQVCDPVLVSRHTMTSPTDLLHHALQGRAVSCPMTEFCRCSTDFLKSRPIHFS